MPVLFHLYYYEYYLLSSSAVVDPGHKFSEEKSIDTANSQERKEEIMLIEKRVS